MRNTRKLLCIMLTAVMLLGILAGCGGTDGDPAAPADGGTSAATGDQGGSSGGDGGAQGGRREVVTMAMTSAADTLNPYNISGNYGDVIFDQIFDHLVYVTLEGEFLPRLADRWEMNEDYTVATFHLNPGITWHDGTPFTAEDMVFTAQLITDEAVTSNRRNYFSSIVGTDDNGVAADPGAVGMVAVDDHTLEIRFKTATDIDAFLALDSTRIYALPKHLLEGADPANLDSNEFFQKPVGTGAFIFESQISGERYELVANMDYFLGAPNFDRFVIRVMDAANIAPALMSGEIDLTSAQGEIPLDDWSMIESLEGIVPAGTESYGYQYMTINCSKDYFQDERVRRAISMAINRGTIVDQLLFGQGEIASTYLPSFHPYYNAGLPGDVYDPEGARALLEEAGWDFDRVLEFYVPTGNKVRENSATLIQQDLQAVGVQTQLMSMDFTTQINYLREGEGDFGLLGGAGSVDPDDARTLLSVGTTMSFSHLDDPSLFELATEARNQPTYAMRKPLYDQLQTRLVEECPYVWLYHAHVLMAHRDIFDNLPIGDFPNLNYAAYSWTFK